LHFLQTAAVDSEFQKTVENWNQILSVVEVKTPDEKLDLLVNRWLVYQTLSCRLRARSSIYQSSGAFGFRDQLQDAMSLVYARPDLARQHILRAASRQFKEGDVQHWWHEPSGAGTRTRIADNLLWLAFVSCFYAEKTGDAEIFDEEITFLDAPVLAEGEQELYLRPVVSNESASLFEHCVRAVEKSLAVGQHGLPLIGAGDWSDGLNHVGIEGKGESVWMGWFLAKILNDFAPVCDARGEKQKARKYRAHARLLHKNLAANAWDGDWYARAFFDDGTPLGSRESDECRIDSLPQSWSVIARSGDAERCAEAIASIEKFLIKKDEKLALLLAPPFAETALDPGYIKSYPLGIRENGGQYTHAAAWLIVAYALSGDGDKAGELFSMVNPLNHTRTRAEIETYKTEPYSIAADVYSHPEHTGRGGWTWYTGAAGWLYRAALEYILGFQKTGDSLKIVPRIPKDWREYEIIYRCRETVYRIKIENPEGASGENIQTILDGKTLKNNKIPLVNDKAEHLVRVILGAAQTKTENDGRFQKTAENLPTNSHDAREPEQIPDSRKRKKP
jgi:cyclic beta-1,2-glucan synthetase